MSEMGMPVNSTALLDAALDAAGGLERWREHSFLSAHLSQAGDLWAMKGQGGVLDDVKIDVALHQEWASHHPFGTPELRSSFTPRRVELRDGDGTTVEALDDPRGSFATQALDTPWTRIQLAYFVGTAMWTYLTQPFCLALPGFRVEELSPWREDRKVLRRLRVGWPEYLASHSTNQTLYFDQEGRLARHDYEVEIVAGAPAAHLFDGFVSVDGITMPTRHRIHARDAAGGIDTSSVIVAIDVDDVAFGQL
jgi:hypothetical protein